MEFHELGDESRHEEMLNPGVWSTILEDICWYLFLEGTIMKSQSLYLFILGYFTAQEHHAKVAGLWLQSCPSSRQRLHPALQEERLLHPVSP